MFHHVSPYYHVFSSTFYSRRVIKTVFSRSDNVLIWVNVDGRVKYDCHKFLHDAFVSQIVCGTVHGWLAIYDGKLFLRSKKSHTTERLACVI
jgi:hypothetical protein